MVGYNQYTCRSILKKHWLSSWISLWDCRETSIFFHILVGYKDGGVCDATRSNVSFLVFTDTHVEMAQLISNVKQAI